MSLCIGPLSTVWLIALKQNTKVELSKLFSLAAALILV